MEKIKKHRRRTADPGQQVKLTLTNDELQRIDRLAKCSGKSRQDVIRGYIPDESLVLIWEYLHGRDKADDHAIKNANQEELIDTGIIMALMTSMANHPKYPVKTQAKTFLWMGEAGRESLSQTREKICRLYLDYLKAIDGVHGFELQQIKVPDQGDEYMVIHADKEYLERSLFDMLAFIKPAVHADLVERLLQIAESKPKDKGMLIEAFKKKYFEDNKK